MSLTPIGGLHGELSGVETLNGSLSAYAHLTGSVTIPPEIETEPYDGSYIVTPKAREAQILATADKKMIEDVIVLSVPYYETSNESGHTVYIAEG